jgi:polyphenol oxidase
MSPTPFFDVYYHNAMNLIIPDWINAPANIGAFTSLRQGGFSTMPYDDGKGGGGLNLGLHVGDMAAHVQQNRLQLQTLLPGPPVWLSQVHGTTVVNALHVTGIPEADASITTERGIVCAIQTADCLPVLFCDTAGCVVGAAHAGWRGLAQGVLENTVTGMRNAGYGDILAWLGPAIGPECFEVGEEVHAAFTDRNKNAEAAFKEIPGQSGKYLADLYQLARLALATVGITRIYGGDFCTMSDEDRFYSYRRNKVTGRMASLIWIK